MLTLIVAKNLRTLSAVLPHTVNIPNTQIASFDKKKDFFKVHFQINDWYIGTGTMQVVWVGKENCAVTWEPEEKIPQKIVEEFEGNIKTTVADCVTSRVGQFSHTLVTSSDTTQNSTSTCRPVVKDADGYVYSTGCYYTCTHNISYSVLFIELSCNYLMMHRGCSAILKKISRGSMIDQQVQYNVSYSNYCSSSNGFVISTGIIATCWPCGIIAHLDELFISESLPQVYGSLHSLLHINQSQTATISKDYQYYNYCRVNIQDHTGFVCYDDGCHLRKFARNPSRSSLTATASRIANLEIVIDRMHFKGHVDSWCKQTCNPDNFIELNDVRS